MAAIPLRSRGLSGDAAEGKLLHTHAQPLHILLTATRLWRSIRVLHWLLRGSSGRRRLQLKGLLLDLSLLFFFLLLTIVTKLFYPFGLVRGLLLGLLEI